MSKAPDFFDTNLLVAATISTHLHHAASNSRLAQLAVNGGACGVHTLAEAFTTLTKRNRYGIPPADATRVLQQVGRTFKIVTLNASEYLRTIESASLLGISGAIVYDALLVACARKAGAKFIYTYNVGHFKRVAPDLADRILEP